MNRLEICTLPEVAPRVGQRGRIDMIKYAEDAAFVMQIIIIEGMSRDHAKRPVRGCDCAPAFL